MAAMGYSPDDKAKAKRSNKGVHTANLNSLHGAYTLKPQAGSRDVCRTLYPVWHHGPLWLHGPPYEISGMWRYSKFPFTFIGALLWLHIKWSHDMAVRPYTY